MKTKVIEIAKTMDNAIEDVNKEYAIKTGAKIAEDVSLAITLLGSSALYLGDAAIHATKLTVRTAKTGVKSAVLKAAEIYYDVPAITIIR